VWLEVASLLPRFVGGDDAFRAWLFTVARRRSIDSSRRAGRRPTEALEGDEDVAGAEAPDDVALDRVSTKATIAWLHRLLTPDQVEILLLRVVAGLPVDATLRRVADRLREDARSA
jgi:RNA polymerase sigma-70 factor (ECF subfamily)